MDKTCVLLSGGLDSSVMLWELSRDSQAYPVYVRNGLFWEDTEVEYARRFVGSIQGLEDTNVDDLRVFDMPVSDVYGDHWSITSEDVPDDESEDEEVYLPGRNILLLSKPAVFCSLNGIHEIAHGTLQSNPFPDSTPEFFDLIEKALSEGLNHDIEVTRPYANASKEDVIRKAHENGLPLELTFSCINPVEGKHCGACNKCAERHDYFEKAGIKDPTDYKNPL